MSASSIVFGGGIKAKRPHKHVCGVPDKECSGSNGSTSNGLKNVKLHNSPQDAWKCYARWLLRQGYIQVGSREFAAPNNGPITFLTKKSRFGKRVRGGKAERFMPEYTTGGHIVSN